jgi:hypothetical protein
MTATLTLAGYEQTKVKLAQLEERLAHLEQHGNLSQQHLEEARLSYEQMISQYRRELKLFEATHPDIAAKR